MERARTYSYLCQSRAIVMDRVAGLSPDQQVHPFPIGPGSIVRTLAHMIVAENYYVLRMLEREVPPYEEWWINENDPPAFAVLRSEWDTVAQGTREAIAAIRDWDRAFEYRVTQDDGQRVIVTTSAGDIFTQLCFHEVHHRAQVLNMLRQCGVTIEKDIDFNAMMFARRGE